MAKIHLTEPVCDEEMISAAVGVLKAGWFLKGKSLSDFEGNFAKYVGTKHAVSVNSGTAALIIALEAMGVGKGDCVITTPSTFIATSNAAIHRGADIVFADTGLDDYCIDPEKTEALIKEKKGKVKAIIPVHLYGYPANMKRINEIADKYGVHVLEDACQAHGTEYYGKMAGNLGDVAAFSFFPSKNMTVCGDGGMVTTNDEQVAKAVRSLKDCGRQEGSQYAFDRIGYTERMSMVSAAIGNVQLSRLGAWIQRKRVVAKIYNEMLEGVGDLVIPPGESADVKPAYYMYALRTKQRDALKAYLESKEVECGVQYPIPIHMQKPYMAMGYKEGMFPNAEAIAREELSIPVHQFLTDEQAKYIADCVKAFFQK